MTKRDAHFSELSPGDQFRSGGEWFEKVDATDAEELRTRRRQFFNQADLVERRWAEGQGGG